MNILNPVKLYCNSMNFDLSESELKRVKYKNCKKAD